MKKSVLLFLTLFLSMTACCQKQGVSSKFNFGFENIQNGKPAGWYNSPNAHYILALDSTMAENGKYAVSIEYKEGEPGFKACTYIIPHSYQGKEITLSGYIKTENVTDGYAGLWMRIDPSIAFNNMNKKGIKGTTGWTKYSITLKMDPAKTKQIVFGGLLAGKGKMWLDNFKVTIDGKDIKDLKPIKRKLFPAEKDKEFDNGSEITNISIGQKTIGKLKTLGLIWGFLKYYHPHIARGEYNWDYELFRILPKVLKSENNKALDEILVKWIQGLGKFSEGKKMKVKPSDIKIKPDLSWIKNSNFSNELTSLLLKVKNAKRQEKNYYIALTRVGNPLFKHENAYSSMVYPDAGFRLLSLYRYWNIIQYFYPYKNLFKEDWKNVLEEFIPRFIAAKNKRDYTLAALELIGQIHDTHANIWGNNPVLNDYFGHDYAPVKITFIENKPVVTSYYNKNLGEETGLKIGDVITKISDMPVEEIVKKELKYSPASNYTTQLRIVAHNLLRTNDSIINIEYVRNNKKNRATLKTFSLKTIINGLSVKDTCFKLINKNIAYINNGALKEKYLPEIWDEIKNTKGLIIDDRNYPSDFPIYALSEYLMPERIPFVKFTKGSIEYPGLFIYSKVLSVGKRNKDYYKGKIIILVNGITQSSAEFHAMAYRVAPNAIVMGSATAGADGNVSKFYLPGGIATLISGIGVYYPDGKETQRIGIVPDIKAKPTIQGVKEGRDELMEKAIDIIKR